MLVAGEDQVDAPQVGPAERGRVIRTWGLSVPSYFARQVLREIGVDRPASRLAT